MARATLTDEQVESEIQRLRKSPFVALARKEERMKYRQRQALYTLRNLEKKGRALDAAGITSEMLDAMDPEEVREAKEAAWQ